MPEPQGEIYELVDKFRADLLRRERRASSTMVREYGRAWKNIQRWIDEMEVDYRRTGGVIGSTPLTPTEERAWFEQYNRLKTLRRQVEVELLRFAEFAEQSIVTEQRLAIEAAQAQAEKLILAGMGRLPAGMNPNEATLMVGYNRLPAAAFRNLVGFLSDGTPLRDLLKELGAEGAQIVADGLMEGLTLGWGARQIAANIRAGLGENLARAMRIARTETLRPYREATHQQFNANNNIVQGWIWRSARNTRTCAMCWAMDGTEHGLDERLDDHVCGRCFQAPKCKSWKELGFDVEERVVEKETGIQAFERLSEEDKLKILGPAKYLAYKDGQITLKDLVGRRFSERWGSMRYEKSLKAVLGEKAKEYYPAGGRRTGGFSWFTGSLSDAGEAIRIGNSSRGWVYYEQILRDNYLPRFNLVDDVEHTIGLWKTSTEPSFNTHVTGKVGDVLAFARAWGKENNQNAVALLIPTQAGKGGALSWDFGRALSVNELNDVLDGIRKVNTELTGMTKSPFEEVGVTVKNRQTLEFWMGDGDNQVVGARLIEKAIQRAQIKIPAHTWRGGYRFELLFSGTDY